MLIRGMAVEILARQEFAEIASRQEGLQIDFSQRPRHFLSPDFRLFSGKPTFSTATPVLDTYLEAGVRFTQGD
jgi:hypothetical protein